jgi:hypothetical protein
LLVNGTSEEEILKTLGIDRAQLAKLQDTLFSEQSFEVASEKPERTFARYRIDQRRNIHALDQLVEELDGNTQYNAVVGAIRLRSDLQDRIIKMGQELGVIKKAAIETNHNHTLGLLIGQMTQGELRTQIKQLGEGTTALVEKYDDKPFLDTADGEMYYGPCLKGETVKVSAKSTPDPEPRPRKRTAKGRRKVAGRQRVSIS